MDGELKPGPLPLEFLGSDRVRVRLPGLDYHSILRSRRRGEVAMVIQRSAGWVLLQTKDHYPPGVFRLPTGSIHVREPATEAMLRELHEEANLVPGSFHLLCRVEYEVEGGRNDFFTDTYLIERPEGQLKPNDPVEAIGGWREAMVSELSTVAEDLRRLEPPWQGWGLFRSVVHDLVPWLLQNSR